jgi:nucleoside-diphosphate-sugar epimerase
MRVVVVGATGNVGTSVVRSLAADPAVAEIVAVARRPPRRPLERAEFISADVRTSDLERLFSGADAVVHLAWLIQPGRNEAVTRSVNVDGSRRLLRAVAAADVPSLVYASSVGAYSAGPKDRRVDESWPTDGIPSSFYSRHKATVERDLDSFERAYPGVRVVRLRPGLIFKRAAASEIRRLFIGPFLPGAVLRSALAPVSPAVRGLCFQAVHSDDVGDAYRAAVLSDVAGPFNIAAEPAIGPAVLAEMLGARAVPVPPQLVRGAAAVTYALHLQPAEPGWVDMGLGVPLMDVTRAQRDLNWTARVSSTDALRELAAGLREKAEDQTWPLARAASGPLRIREFLTGLGRRQ